MSNKTHASDCRLSFKLQYRWVETFANRFESLRQTICPFERRHFLTLSQKHVVAFAGFRKWLAPPAAAKFEVEIKWALQLTAAAGGAVDLPVGKAGHISSFIGAFTNRFGCPPALYDSEHANGGCADV